MKDPVCQKDNFGCGVACLAFITNRSYEEIVKELGEEKAKKEGFSCRQLVAYLKGLGYQAEFHYLNQKWRQRIYQEGTIVFLKRSKKFPFGHYLARYHDFWMDPWLNFLKEKNLTKAKAGFRKRLLGKPIYGIFCGQTA
ncbi:hypothetical protein KBI33_01180 [Candidatus Shapirobacteria bacterium]|nr:hypothetical protein [Candidatus Shapirobacteria bacterium]